MLAEIISRLKRPNELKNHAVFNEKILKLVLDNMIKENNIDDRKIYKFDTIQVSNKLEITCYSNPYFINAINLK